MGIWKNFDELEESLNMSELEMILKQKREKEKNERLFAASLQGVDLTKNEPSEVEQAMEEARRRAAIQQLGEQEVERQELAELGFGFEVESD